MLQHPSDPDMVDKFLGDQENPQIGVYDPNFTINPNSKVYETLNPFRAQGTKNPTEACETLNPSRAQGTAGQL